jgi:hypothetical protein
MFLVPVRSATTATVSRDSVPARKRVGSMKVFKRIISRENGTPWPATEMTSEKWLHVPVSYLKIKDLIATQDGVYFHALRNKHQTLGIDKYPHVVLWNDEYYLEDGHHRVMRAVLKGQKKIFARVLVIKETS